MNLNICLQRVGIVLAFMTLSVSVRAQHFKLKKFSEEDLDFFLLTGKTPAEKQINTFLHGAELHSLPGKYKQSPFESIRPAAGSNQGVTGLRYTVLNNTSQIFSVEVNGEYSSASLNEYGHVYNFDASTGKLIKFRDLLTDAGYEAINKIVISNRKKRLSAYLKNMKDVTGGYKAVYTTYSECLRDMEGDELNDDDLKFQKEGLLLIRRSCSGQHYFQALEDKADVYNNRLTLKSLEPYLNAYGKCLLLTKNANCTPTIAKGFHEGLYTGKINHQYAITLVIDRIYKDRIYASYYYDKVGKEINLRCSMEKGQLKMKEDNMDGKENNSSATFQLSLPSNGKMTGIWSNGKNTYPVELQ
ncbi:hypothetical protein [Pedobacter sp.]|jgi:hypothetical protein|uniref:hypothetical protein n=1 Tax=Pedobacter sp. TaxID=1411316 RepID=UPI002C8BA208|nr:hypothetical protein [Pedobacter sp.]HWW41115.1 hypothetical protein [Pedobacter sp.]